MSKFEGDLADLKAAVQSIVTKGEWTSADGKEIFRAKSGEVVNWFTSTGTIQFQGKKNEDLSRAVHAACSDEGQIEVVDREGTVSETKRVFIVHGHDKAARQQLELLLYKLELKPFVLQDEDGESNTIIEALEKQIYQGSSFGIVLMTPDDYGYAKTAKEQERQPRAR